MVQKRQEKLLHTSGLEDHPKGKCERIIGENNSPIKVPMMEIALTNFIKNQPLQLTSRYEVRRNGYSIVERKDLNNSGDRISYSH